MYFTYIYSFFHSKPQLLDRKKTQFWNFVDFSASFHNSDMHLFDEIDKSINRHIFQIDLDKVFFQDIDCQYNWTIVVS